MSSKYFFTNIIILNYYGKKDTLECINSIAKDSDHHPIKIILINNSPDDKFSQDTLSSYSFDIKYITLSDNKGFCGGNNIGIQQALDDSNCAYIMLLNNDTIVTSGMIKTLQSLCKRNPRLILNPIIMFHNSDQIQCTGGKWNIVSGLARNSNKSKHPTQITKDISPDYLNGCCIFAHRNVFENVGGFDENFFAYCEDIDFSWRAQKQGYTLLVTKDALLYHKHSQGSATTTKVYLICRNTVLLMRKHFALLTPLLIPIHYLTQLMTGFFVHRIRNIFVLYKIVSIGFVDGIRNRLSFKKD